MQRDRPHHHPAAPASLPPRDERSLARRRWLHGSRVTKKLRVGALGTLKLAKHHGDALVCVRYRCDALKLYRFTTIELVVAATPIRPERFDAATFGLRLGKNEHTLRATVRAQGGRWDRQQDLWWLRGATIRELGLVERICCL